MTQPGPDTADLRSGPPLHDALLALLPLVGVWRGEGAGVVASTGAEFRFGQQVGIVHDGRPFLAYESRSWLLDADGAVIRPAWRESGFWRPGPGEDDVELVLASNTGQALMFTGTAGDQQWEVATQSAVHAPSGMAVDGERRLYAVRGAELVYATELAPGGQPYAPHLNARLVRVAAAADPDPG
ncbi:MAG TPA: FABP family protein [Jatrophihabitans sp.]|uniref:FABP family protein n=1 Tax=Jatrophihabitans sp. TaxID=1932789 RepID=UPI002E07DC69|nr:FABP family protein [Jatrophihabitans sp.]